MHTNNNTASTQVGTLLRDGFFFNASSLISDRLTNRMLYIRELVLPALTETAIIMFDHFLQTCTQYFVPRLLRYLANE